MAAKKSTKKSTKSAKNTPASDVSRDEQIGFHKGSLMTLSKEREELGRMLNIVEQLMQMHAAALKELGVDLEAAQAAASGNPPPKKKPPIEDLL